MELLPLRVIKTTKVIICTYADINKKDIKKHIPKLIYFKNDSNIIDKIKSSIPVQRNNVVSVIKCQEVCG